MNKIIPVPDKKLRHISCDVNEDNIIISMKSHTKQAKCLYCGKI